MNDFQEQAKNWLRNVVKQNPDKIKSGVEKAGDLIDKQTGGKYAEKVDTVQQKVGGFVDKHSSDETPTEPASDATTGTGTAGTAESAESAQPDGSTDAPTDAANEPTGSAADQSTGAAPSSDEATENSATSAGTASAEGRGQGPAAG
jgi:hypothetical protein